MNMTFANDSVQSHASLAYCRTPLAETGLSSVLMMNMKENPFLGTNPYLTSTW